MLTTIQKHLMINKFSKPAEDISMDNQLVHMDTVSHPASDLYDNLQALKVITY